MPTHFPDATWNEAGDFDPTHRYTIYNNNAPTAGSEIYLTWRRNFIGDIDWNDPMSIIAGMKEFHLAKVGAGQVVGSVLKNYLIFDRRTKEGYLMDELEAISPDYMYQKGYRDGRARKWQMSVNSDYEMGWEDGYSDSQIHGLDNPPSV